MCVCCVCTVSVCSAVNTAARQRCRDRLRAAFQATAAIRFFISGMNKSKWERALPSANTTDDEENWVLTVDDDDSSDADY